MQAIRREVGERLESVDRHSSLLSSNFQSSARVVECNIRDVSYRTSRRRGAAIFVLLAAGAECLRGNRSNKGVRCLVVESSIQLEVW